MASVFIEETEDMKIESESLTEKPKLSEGMKQLVQVLSKREKWSIAEVEEMCKARRLMYGSILNSVNNWSEATYCELFLEEDGDDLRVALHLLQEADSA